jgi:hypothetical protein
MSGLGMIRCPNIALEPLILLFDSLNATLNILPTQICISSYVSTGNLKSHCLQRLHCMCHKLTWHPLMRSFTLQLSSFHSLKITYLPFLLKEHIVQPFNLVKHTM